MKPASFAAGLIGILAVVSGPDHPFSGEQPVMVGKARADGDNNGGKAGRRAPPMPMARDPAAAVAEEYEAARRKGTREAFELFIARHGDNPLAEQARADLWRLSR
ncbi:hypothetical protein [Bradyrhizobium yuanmingense]|uniref:hypothetical protein n=1 Tax=Bradyrhizobium yuanmingense TaxID=108015 RepID=UPI0023B976B8|nr:hypothetical protein [Bradyrhizobium yuanmingense]MDF0499084.1 hypothetical protein [Bradyrhizobium yuanmingense]